MITVPHIVKDDSLQDKVCEHRQGYNRTEQQNEIVLMFDIVTCFDGKRIHSTPSFHNVTVAAKFGASPLKYATRNECQPSADAAAITLATSASVLQRDEISCSCQLMLSPELRA